MARAYFSIRDGARRKAAPCAFMLVDKGREFEIDINPGVSADEVPAFFAPFIEKGERHIDGALALRWVHERVRPPGRQNLGEVLAAHGLNEYSELALLRSGHGMSSQDSFILEEIDEASYNARSLDRMIKRRQALGASIKARRMGLGMSQRELADAVGIDQPALSKIEAGKANITFDLLADIDEALTEGSQPMLNLARQILWNAERKELHELIARYASPLAQIYERLIDELEAYSDVAPSALADSRIISHCFREFMNAFPSYSDESMLQKSMQGREYAALHELYPLLDELPSDEMKDEGFIPIPLPLHHALMNLRMAHSAGSSNKAQRMRVAVSGTKNDPVAPISAWKDAKTLAEKTAHFLRGEDEEIPTLQDYQSSLAVLEKVIKVRLGDIYDAKDDLFKLIERANRIDSEGAYDPPSKEEVAFFISMIGDVNLRMAAFQELKNPYWLEALDAMGFFDDYYSLNEADSTPFPPAPFLLHCLAFDADAYDRVVG